MTRLRSRLFILSTLVLLNSCAFKSDIPGSWHPTLWGGSPEACAIVRPQKGASIPCCDEEFENYVCMTWEDFIWAVELAAEQGVK